MMRKGAASFAGAVVLLAFASPFLYLARASGEDGEQASIPGASVTLPLHGRIDADGRRIDTSIYRSSDALDAHFARLESLWEGAPVDLHRERFPGGAALGVFDIHHGLHWTYRIGEREGGVEVLRAVSPLSPEAPRRAEGMLERLELPEGLAVLSRITDRLEGRSVETAILLSSEPWPPLARQLGLSREGCELSGSHPAEEAGAGGSADEGETFCGERGSLLLHATADPSMDDLSWVVLQVVETGGRP